MSKIVSLKPTFDNLVVEPIKAKTQTESGFFVPESSQKKPNIGKVIDIGNCCKSGVKVGDFVILPKNLNVTTNIEVNGTEFEVVKEEHIIAIVNFEE